MIEQIKGVIGIAKELIETVALLAGVVVLVRKEKRESKPPEPPE